METELQDVETSQVSTSTEVAESSPVVETSGESQASVTATDDAQSTQQAETDPLQDVPTVEELQKLVEQKVPHSAALARLRPAYEGLRTQFGELQSSFEPWKPIVETVGDPQLAQSAYELVSALYTPSTENPSGFDPKPFLDQVEVDSPGTVNQLFSTICSYQIQDEQGQPSTVVRELYRAHGLDPDRIDDYRNIDNLRASGVVTADDLSKVPEKYHEAFKSMSQAAREDLLEVIGSKPLVAEEALRNAQDALEARQYRERQQQSDAEKQQQQEAEFKTRVESAVTEGVNTKIQAWSNSIHQSLSSQWKPSTDEAVNEFEYAKVIGAIAALQHPAYRPIVEKALGAEATAGFDDLVNQWSTSYSAQVTYAQMGQENSIPAKRVKAAADLAEQRILLKLGDFAKRLSEPTSTRTQQASQQQATQLATAAGRFIPNGNGNQQQGFQNPYEQITAPFGSPEYYKAIREIDAQYKVTHGSMFGG